MDMIAENEGVQTDPGVCRCVFLFLHLLLSSPFPLLPFSFFIY